MQNAASLQVTDQVGRPVTLVHTWTGNQLLVSGYTSLHTVSVRAEFFLYRNGGEMYQQFRTAYLPERCFAYLCNIEVNTTERRRGLGRLTLLACEPLLVNSGAQEIHGEMVPAPSMSLEQLFSFYVALGYEIRSPFIVKSLHPRLRQG